METGPYWLFNTLKYLVLKVLQSIKFSTGYELLYLFDSSC